MENIKTSKTTLINLLFVIFALSGFSGLIYESIWTHYLKLFLGHAAFAQTLVLVIFMGGMALGSWISSRTSIRWKNLFLTYAIVEAVIGLFALIFHPVFVEATSLSYSQVMPALGSDIAVSVYKWTLAGLLILPQSILLGMTFPLMSAGIIRLDSTKVGSSLSMLYFTNSIGAAVGVLVSGFLLIGMFGLPGTVIVAGLINLVIALLVWLFSRNINTQVESSAEPMIGKLKASSNTFLLLISVAFITGAASFMYEIGWIRMLSLVLGSSTHSFEMMLSAFIFGLAFGGLWIRKRIDNIQNPILYLGGVQIVMGLFALATIPIYNGTFDIMQFAMSALNRSESGYMAYNIILNTIALMVMLPATFCAGITLPLITNVLIKKGGGEKAIGRVYAANTVGAIVGLTLAINVGLPVLGLKGLISSGVFLDVTIGILLIYLATSQRRYQRTALTAASVLVTFSLVILFFPFDLNRLTAGVYRTGMAAEPDNREILFYRDGKTASVSIVKLKNALSIRTNGKPDANINLQEKGIPTADEPTMILAGAIPLALNPSAQEIANIGIGSGLTTHTLLGSSRINRVDTIEIEPFMAEAAQYFRPKVERTFSDKRSKIFFDDAKSFFTTQQKKYDIIISEPSNPWVSGISSLFTIEFYSLISQHLANEGLFAQWLHVYESDISLVASVIKAISASFSDYAIYHLTDGDILIVAKNHGKIGGLSNEIFKHEKLKSLLEHIYIQSFDDLRLMKIGDKDTIDAVFSLMPVPVNSDFFPFLDLNAVKARFLNRLAGELMTVRLYPIPFYELLDKETEKNSKEPIYAGDLRYPPANRARSAAKLYDTMLHAESEPESEIGIPLITKKYATNLMLGIESCRLIDDDELLHSFLEFSGFVVPYLSSSQLKKIWLKLESRPCFVRLNKRYPKWVALVTNVGERNNEGIRRSASLLLPELDFKNKPSRSFYALSAAMLGNLATGNPNEAYEIWKRYIPEIVRNVQKPPFVVNYIGSLSAFASKDSSFERRN